MIEIDDKIVSTDLLRECFACDLGACKGICCVEGKSIRSKRNIPTISPT